MSKSKLNLLKQPELMVLVPIVYMFTTVFLTRDYIQVYFGLGIAMLLVEAYLVKINGLKDTKAVAVGMIALASIGLVAASVLTIEKIELLQNPNYVTSCSVSPIVSCSPVVASPQASAFSGIPNPILGVFGFGAVFTAGVTLLAGAEKLRKSWWITLFAGTIFGTAFSIWLISQGIYNIGKLCLYCMSVWMVVFSLFWLIGTELVRQKVIVLPKKVSNFFTTKRDLLITASIGIVILLIYFRWSDYWNSLI